MKNTNSFRKALKSNMSVLLKSFLSIFSLQRINFKLYNRLNQIYSDSREHSPMLRILGNGESLKNELSSVYYEEFDYMVVNRHVLSESYEKIKPMFYVIADPHFFLKKEGLDILEKIDKKTTWKMFLFVPSFYYSNIKDKITSGCITVIPYNSVPITTFDPIKYFFYNRNLAMPRPQNVIVAAIYIAISLKYAKIELYGVEHSWTRNLEVNDNNEVCLLNPHFFDKNEVKLNTWKEIHPELDLPFHSIIRLYAYMFESYHELKKYADKRGVAIINCTRKSFIDAFDRKK